MEVLKALRERAEATLGLLDTAASHVLATSNGGFSLSLRSVGRLSCWLLRQNASSRARARSRRMDVFGLPGSRISDSKAAASPPSSSRPSAEETRRLASEPSS
jgi:hypothetical protein